LKQNQEPGAGAGRPENRGKKIVREAGRLGSDRADKLISKDEVDGLKDEN